MIESDKELLELAAKAAGYIIEWCPQWSGGYGGYMKTVIPAPSDPVLSTSLHWHPLIDDGDALRLKNKLRLPVIYTDQGVNVAYDDVLLAFEPWGFDAVKAERRAIVRAAAEIQRAKEKE